jgi:hypothetical protein
VRVELRDISREKRTTLKNPPHTYFYSPLSNNHKLSASFFLDKEE